MGTTNCKFHEPYPLPLQKEISSGEMCKIDVFLYKIVFSNLANRKSPNYMVMMNKEGSTKVVNFITAGAEGSWSRAWPHVI